MKFEHLIQINDPENPLIISLHREELWQGLLQRALDPRPFLPGLESCHILEKSEGGWRRELNFGPATIEDVVTLHETKWVCFTTQPSSGHAGGSLTIYIEEPQPNMLYLRFVYQTNLGENGQLEDHAYIEYVKSAYHQSDIDTVRIIRTLAASGTPQ